MRITRWIIFSFSALALVALLSRYDSLPNELSGQLGQSPETELAATIDTLRDRDPAAADALQSLSDTRRRRVIEAMLRTEKRKAAGDGVRTAERLARLIDGGAGSHSSEEARYHLALMASDPALIKTRAERDSFIAGNATVVDAIGSIRPVDEHGAMVADQAIGDFLRDLERVEEAPADYRPVADDPIGIMLFDDEVDLKVRQFYLTTNSNADHPDWLKAVIAQTVQASRRGTAPFRLTSLANTSPNHEPPEQLSVADVVRIAYNHHPLFQQSFFDDLALPEEERRPAPVVVALFRDYGELIRIATGPKGDVPRSEILDVLFANEDFVERWRIERGESEKATLELAAHFANLQKSSPAVWREARYSPLALRLQEAAPLYANEVLEQFGPDDIATLLLSGYEDTAAKATEAVARFGDLAIVVLQMYADEAGGSDGLFHRALQNPNVGVRIVPFVAAKGDEGLTKLESDIGWLDKYFHPDGRPRDEVVWYEAVPVVGAPAKVVANWSKGHPSTWGELGWAAVDLADGALLVATFGASAAKSPAQQAAKQAAKRAAKQGAKMAAIQSGKRLAANTTRIAARQARKQIGRSLLRGGAALRLVGTAAMITGKVVSSAWKAFGYVLSATYKACATVVSTAGDLRRAWGRVPQSVRRAVYGGLLAASMYVRVRERTIPNLPVVGEEIARFAGKTITAAGKTGATMFAAAIDEVFGHPPQWLVGWVAYVGMCLVAAVIAWQSRPWLRRRVIYV